MSHILIIGPKFSSLTAYLEQNGHTYTQLRDTSPDRTVKNSIFTNFSNEDSLQHTLTNLPDKPDGVIAIYESYILPASRIAEFLNLPGIPVAAAEACTDKFIMRNLFAKSKIKISPDYALINSEKQLLEFADRHQYPLILKPTNLAKSLLVTKNHDKNELIKNYQKSMDLLHGTYKKYAPNRNPQLIVEEFLEGSIHSVDAFIDSDGKVTVLPYIVDYQTGYDIGYDDNFHYSRLLPSSLNDKEQKDLQRCAEVGVKALGMKNTPAHIEIIMTPNGPRIVEIGARNGGYRERMHMLANGIDIIGSAVNIALGKKPVLTTSKNEPCAVLELFPKNPGTFVDVSNISQLKQLKSLHYLSIKATLGDIVGKSSDGYKMCAIIILHNSNRTQFEEDLNYINSHVAVVTK